MKIHHIIEGLEPHPDKRTVYHVESWDDRFNDFTVTGTDVWKNPDKAIAWAKRQYGEYGGRWQVTSYSNMKPKPHNWGTDEVVWSSEQDITEGNSEASALVKRIKDDIKKSREVSDILAYELGDDDYDDDDYDYYDSERYQYDRELEDLEDDIEDQLKRLKELNPRVWQQVKDGWEKYWDAGVMSDRHPYARGGDVLGRYQRKIYNPKRSKRVAQGKVAGDPMRRNRKAPQSSLDQFKSSKPMRHADTVKTLNKKLP